MGDMALDRVAPKSVDFVKVDVENFECHVLRGGDGLFTKYSPKFLKFETSINETRDCVMNAAAKHGYRIFDIATGMSCLDYGSTDKLMVHPTAMAKPKHESNFVG